MLYARREEESRLARLCLCRLEGILGMSSDQLMVYDATTTMTMMMVLWCLYRVGVVLGVFDL